MTKKEQIERHAIEAEKIWGKAYRYFPSVIQTKRLSVGVEIGVAFGGHSEAILRWTEVARLYGVDPYENQPGYDDPMNLPQGEFDELYRFTTNRLSKFGDRYRHLRTYSAEALQAIPDLVDFIYIDADHSYEGVYRDLCMWYGKVREGGVIGGHDYGHTNFPGVAQAIDEFFGRLGWKVRTEGEGVWWVEKERVPISFFIPAYNCADTIEQSVKSILAKNFSDSDELIVVNDGSTDKTDEVLQRLERQTHNICLLRHGRNKGGAAARNTAAEAAQHHLLFCLDSDNLLVPGSIKRLKDFLIGSGSDAAAFEEVHFFSEDTSIIDKKWVFKAGQVTMAEYLVGPVVPGASGNYMFTKSSWIRARGYPEFSGALDAWGFGLRQVATGQKVTVMPDSFYYHRYGHDSYWVRDFRKGCPSIVALQILMPFLDQIHKEDIDYIMSSAGRYDWFENLDRHPIRLKTGNVGQAGVIAHKRMISRLGAARSYLRRVARALIKRVSSS